MRHWWCINLAAALLLCCCCGQKKAAPESPIEQPPGGTGERMEAPVHHAPDQERIDSLKQEKLREKNP